MKGESLTATYGGYTLEELERLEKAATPGPWDEYSERSGGRTAWIKGATGEWAAMACGATNANGQANAALIAAMRNALHDLIAAAREAERLREAVAREHALHVENVASLSRRAEAAEARAKELEAEVARLREALVHIEEYWNRSQTDAAMADALWHIIDTVIAALSPEPQE